MNKEQTNVYRRQFVENVGGVRLWSSPLSSPILFPSLRSLPLPAYPPIISKTTSPTMRLGDCKYPPHTHTHSAVWGGAPAEIEFGAF